MDMSGQLHAPAASHSGKGPFDIHCTEVLSVPQSWYERGGKEKKITAPAGNRTPVVQPVV
jgi:hypothetical protein